jgi:hypothetical protein
MRPGQAKAAAVGYLGDGGAVTGAIPSIEAFASAALRHAKVRDCSVVLWLSYMSADKLNLAFVVPDDTSSRELSDLFATLGRLHRSTEDLWRTRFSNGELQPYFPSFAYPVVVSRSMWTCWREVSPFDGAAIAASGRTLIGPDDGLREMPSIAALQRGAEVQYAALLSLKNNWRTLDVAGATRLYAAMVNHVRGVLSAASGTALAGPTTLRFASAEDGYRAVSEELDLLRERLERISSRC